MVSHSGVRAGPHIKSVQGLGWKQVAFIGHLLVGVYISYDISHLPAP